MASRERVSRINARGVERGQKGEGFLRGGSSSGGAGLVGGKRAGEVAVAEI